jgi:hypothetical protein
MPERHNLIVRKINCRLNARQGANLRVLKNILKGSIVPYFRPKRVYLHLVMAFKHLCSYQYISDI